MLALDHQPAITLEIQLEIAEGDGVEDIKSVALYGAIFVEDAPVDTAAIDSA